LAVGVAVEGLEVADFGQQQAWFAAGHLADAALVVAQRLARLGVVLDERDRGRAHACGLGHVQDVHERGVALAGGVELADTVDAEP
jgi:hypothetical protein